MNLKNIAALLVFSAASYAASAQSNPVHANTRIHQGVKSGELTRAERAKLKAEEARLKMERKDYKQDGISPSERKDLRKDKRRLNRNIYRQKHDGQTRP